MMNGLSFSNYWAANQLTLTGSIGRCALSESFLAQLLGSKPIFQILLLAN
jgi:hypothetical protein